MRKLAIGCYASLLVLLVAAPAVASQAAPPQYQSSEPSDGAAVHQAPDTVEVTFDQPLDSGSSLSVTDACGRSVDDGSTEVSGTTMSIGLEDKPSGRYLVEYVARGIGGLTGEEKGDFSFLAHGGDDCKRKGSQNNHSNGHGNDGQGNGNGDHEGNHGEKNVSNGHAGNDHSAGSAGGSTATTHSGTDHSTTATSGHNGAGPDAQGGNQHSGSGHQGGSQAAGPETIDGITSSDTQRELLTRADSTTLLISLALCAALGILGGVVLRATGAK